MPQVFRNARVHRFRNSESTGRVSMICHEISMNRVRGWGSSLSSPCPDCRYTTVAQCPEPGGCRYILDNPLRQMRQSTPCKPPVTLRPSWWPASGRLMRRQVERGVVRLACLGDVICHPCESRGLYEHPRARFVLVVSGIYHNFTFSDSVKQTSDGAPPATEVRSATLTTLHTACRGTHV